MAAGGSDGVGGDAAAPGPVMLFTGHRHRRHDDLYGAEFRALATAVRPSTPPTAGAAAASTPPLPAFAVAEAWSREAPLPGAPGSVAAPSGPPPPPRYAHHCMVSRPWGATVGRLLLAGPDATVVVCGNAKQMPKDVEGAVTSIVEHFVVPALAAEDGEAPPADAAAAADGLVRGLRQAGRYVTDTWA